MAYAAVIAGIMFMGADAIDVVLIDLVAIPWIIGPVAVAAFCVRASETANGATAFAIFEVALIAFTAITWVDLLVIHRDAQNGIALMFSVPICQYGAVAIFFTAARLSGWRAREGWSSDKPGSYNH